MSVVVMKFGGTSVGSAEQIRQSAQIEHDFAGSDRVLVVVSALSGVTDLILGTVTEAGSGARQEIARAEIGRDGVGCEPASAATLAGLKKLVRSGFVCPHESVVLILTGHLLKDPEYCLKFYSGELFPEAGGRLSELRRPAIKLEPDVEAVIGVLEAAGRS